MASTINPQSRYHSHPSQAPSPRPPCPVRKRLQPSSAAEVYNKLGLIDQARAWPVEIVHILVKAATRDPEISDDIDQLYATACSRHRFGQAQHAQSPVDPQPMYFAECPVQPRQQHVQIGRGHILAHRQHGQNPGSETPHQAQGQIQVQPNASRGLSTPAATVPRHASSSQSLDPAASLRLKPEQRGLSGCVQDMKPTSEPRDNIQASPDEILQQMISDSTTPERKQTSSLRALNTFSDGHQDGIPTTDVCARSTKRRRLSVDTTSPTQARKFTHYFTPRGSPEESKPKLRFLDIDDVPDQVSVSDKNSPEPEEPAADYMQMLKLIERDLGLHGEYDKYDRECQLSLGMPVAVKIEVKLNKLQQRIDQHRSFQNRVHILSVMQEIVMAVLMARDSCVASEVRKTASRYDDIFVMAFEKLTMSQRRQLRDVDDGAWIQGFHCFLEEAKGYPFLRKLP
ncbi:hypothetical protein F5Y15DRAFT_371328 [Xylariaceae sp. FL0016]|nr:hypothetical protein F5Y15DRAFT_371328 [Xylariaceae sp. FL0016]